MKCQRRKENKLSTKLEIKSGTIGRGIFATEPIMSGEELIKVKSDSIISTDTAIEV